MHPGVMRVTKRRRLVVGAVAVFVAATLVLPQLASAENGESPGGDGSLLNSLLDQPQPVVTNAEAGTTGTPTSDASAASDPSDSGTATATNAATAGAAIVPPATPLIVAAYATDPGQLQSGSRFKLSLKITDPGADDAEGVVVRIGPSTSAGWGSSDELAVIGSGSAKFIGPIQAGATDDSASFDLIANPASPGGLRSIPVEITWKSRGFEHTASEAVGLLVNSFVALDATFRTSSAPVQKEPFAVTLKVRNLTGRAVKGVCVVFSGKGARPSTQETLTVGDLAPGTARSVTTTFTAPLVGRAMLLATVAYVDDFGDVRTMKVQGWAHVVRTAPDTEPRSDTGVTQVMTALAALLGLNG